MTIKPFFVIESFFFLIAEILIFKALLTRVSTTNFQQIHYDTVPIYIPDTGHIGKKWQQINCNRFRNIFTKFNWCSLNMQFYLHITPHASRNTSTQTHI
uniref:Uncharacterized protein n=1 Tax=Anguilla anguilla TaxID=7936 RepID=A0A0E9X5M2_ANGAN